MLSEGLLHYRSLVFLVNHVELIIFFQSKQDVCDLPQFSCSSKLNKLNEGRGDLLKVLSSRLQQPDARAASLPLPCVHRFADLNPHSRVSTSPSGTHFYQNSLSAPASCVKRSRRGLIGPLQGRRFTPRSDTINLQSNRHNQRLHESHQHSRAPWRLRS